MHEYISFPSLIVILRAVDNNLHGSLPNELNYFSEMVLLNLYFNELTGTIPDLSELIKVEQIDLDGNTLSGNTPESLFKLPNISTSEQIKTHTG